MLSSSLIAFFPQMPAPIKREQVCIRCGTHPLKAKAGDTRKRRRPVIRRETNAVSERIAWCTCVNCGKVTPLSLE